MSDELTKARELVRDGDVGGVMRHLRFTAAKLPVGDLAETVGWASERMGFDDLVQASRALAAAPGEPQALYDFGYACLEHGASYAAVPALETALRAVPGNLTLVYELVAALEAEYRHGDAVAVLEEPGVTLPDWPGRYLIAYNAVLAGDLARAEAVVARMAEPDDPHWTPARDRLSRMLRRASEARPHASLDGGDLRGWHYVLTGGVLGTLSPYGFSQGMTGRYAFQQDDYGLCGYGIERLRLVLDAAGREPVAVTPLPDRSSRILGMAAARLLDLPLRPYAPGTPDTLVVAYDLTEAEEETLGGLFERSPGQILYEHATCWTDPPAVSADVSALLRQTGGPPWGSRLTGESPERLPPDDRPEEEVVADIVSADTAPDAGDGETPADTAPVLAAFVTGVAPGWLDGPRSPVGSPGPVRSSRFL
jgi:hypothetical protein